jgi:hypothetical protein
VHRESQASAVARLLLIDHGRAGVELQHYVGGLREMLGLQGRPSTMPGNACIVDVRDARRLVEQVEAIAARLVEGERADCRAAAEGDCLTTVVWLAQGCVQLARQQPARAAWGQL